jgi:hypothetical protein
MASSLALLDSVNFNLEYNDPMQDVSEALAASASALDDWAQGSAAPRPMSVYPKPVATTRPTSATARSTSTWRETQI